MDGVTETAHIFTPFELLVNESVVRKTEETACSWEAGHSRSPCHNERQALQRTRNSCGAFLGAKGKF